MKLKLVVASLAALGSVSAFAAPLDPATATVAPANYIYVAGASAQSQAFNAVAKSLFDVSDDVVQIVAAAPCGDAGDIQKHVAYLGVRGGVNTMVVYRNNGGSGSGTLQLLAKTTSAPQIATSGSVIKLPASAVAGASGSYTASSTNCAAKLPAMALQDVKPAEHTSAVTGLFGTTNYDAASVLKSPLATGLQGFGVAVSASLYNALVTANTNAGIPLVNGQPSIRRADYASLTNIAGTIKTAADLLNNPSDAGTIEIARRVPTSGTQASSEIFFLSGKTAGAQIPATALDFPIADFAANGIGVTEGASTGNVKTRLNLAGNGTAANPAPDYAIGVMSLENLPTATDTWKWVALDGVSPNQAFDLHTSTIVADPFQRQAVASGSYPLAYESFVIYRDAAFTTLATFLANEIKKTGNSNLVGFAYEDLPGTWAAWQTSNTPANDYLGNTNKQSRVSRSGNNLSPLQY